MKMDLNNAKKLAGKLNELVDIGKKKDLENGLKKADEISEKMKEKPVNLDRVKHAITASSIKMLKGTPFYGHIFCQLPVVYSETEVPTMGVGKYKGDLLVKLFVNPRYIEKIIDENGWPKAQNHFVQVLRHEMIHLVFKHLFIKEERNKRLEIACELDVNSYVDKKDLVDNGVFPEKFGFDKELGWREYYKLLEGKIKEYKITVKMGEGSGEQDGEGSGGSEKDGSGNGKGGYTLEIEGPDGKKMSTLDGHGKWDEAKKDEALTSIMMDKIISNAKDICEKTNKWGDVPGSICEFVDLSLRKEIPMVDWEVALRDFISSSSETELAYTNKKLSKRYGTRPGTRKYEKLRVAIGIDTSGSIDRETLSMFFSELEWIAKANVEMTVFECDCTIGRVYPFEDFNEESLKNVTGGGGTDLEPVIKEASEQGYDACIYFTDGYAEKIKEDYNIPVLLVVEESYEHLEKENLPYPAQMVFYVKDGKVQVQ